MPLCSCSLKARTPAQLTVSGTLGYVRMNTMFHRATSITIATAAGTRTTDTPYLGNGYVHEAIEAGQCLRAGLLESSGMPLDKTLALMGCSTRRARRSDCATRPTINSWFLGPVSLLNVQGIFVSWC